MFLIQRTNGLTCDELSLFLDRTIRTWRDVDTSSMDAGRRSRHRGTFQSRTNLENGRQRKRKGRESTDMERVNQLFPNESFLPENQIVADVLLHEYIPVVRSSFPSSVLHFFLLIYIN